MPLNGIRKLKPTKKINQSSFHVYENRSYVAVAVAIEIDYAVTEPHKS